MARPLYRQAFRLSNPSILYVTTEDGVIVTFMDGPGFREYERTRQRKEPVDGGIGPKAEFAPLPLAGDEWFLVCDRPIEGMFVIARGVHVQFQGALHLTLG